MGCRVTVVAVHAVRLGALSLPAVYDGDVPLLTLVEAIAASPTLAHRDLVFVARAEPDPVIAVFGDLEPHEVDFLASLPRHLASVWSRLMVVSHEQVEQDCADLASALLHRPGAALLRSARFRGIPRGGLVVLGLLSYLLDLRPEQLHDDEVAPADAPLVLVDDVAYSGLRFGETLRGLRNRQVVFAPLYAPPGLASAIERAEPRVLACVSGRELRDVAPDRLGSGYAEWVARWEGRGLGYWSGLSNYLCLPWNEPDSVWWNERAGRAEAAWRVMPARACLKNRVAGRSRAQLQPPATGFVQPEPDVVYADHGDSVVAADLARQVSIRLAGVGSAMWRTALTSASRRVALDRLAADYDVEPDQLARDLDRFVDSLIDRRLCTVR